MRKLVSAILINLAVVIGMPALAFAHVVVSPNQANVGAFTTFTVGVPNEKDVAVTGLRLVMPDGLKYTQPTVQSGWTIETKQSGDNVTEISWTNGNVPAGQREAFTFSSQTPAKATTLNWKVYQTYEDGTVVAWDQTPSTKGDEEESETSGPYSTTKITNDLAASTTKTASDDSTSSKSVTASYVISLLALVLSVVALVKRGKA